MMGGELPRSVGLHTRAALFSAIRGKIVMLEVFSIHAKLERIVETYNMVLRSTYLQYAQCLDTALRSITQRVESFPHQIMPTLHAP